MRGENMSKKLVSLPRNVAEEIESLKNVNVVNEFLLNRQYLVDIEADYILDWLGEKRIINSYIYYRAITEGYEIEEKPEDKIKRMYDMYKTDHQETIRDVLETLNIKIEGVNQ